MYLLFDIGGTNTRIATTEDKETLAKTKIIPTEQDFEQQIQLVAQSVQEIVGSEEIEGAVVGVAGALTPQKDALISSPNLSSWIQRPLKEELEFNFDCPVYLENDAALGGLGEACFGEGKDFNIIAFITIGTGIGGAKIVDKQIDRNSLGFEPGHQIIELEGHPCNCGGLGHLETLVGGAYIEKRYGQKAENIKDPQVWDKIAKDLAIGLNNTVVHWSPDVIILNGTVAQKIPLQIVQSDLNNYLKVFPSPEIIKGTLGHEAGLYGGLKIVQSISSE